MSDAQAVTPLAGISERLARAARLRGDAAIVPELIAISKTRTPGEIEPLLAQGHRSFGENRVQEAAAKWPELRARWTGVRLHLVGQLQSNKTGEAVALFDAIHSIDRPNLIATLAAAMAKQGRRPDCYVQVNVGEEAQKGGCSVGDLPGLLEKARDAGLPIVGLMCVPPADREPAPYFALLATLAARHDLPGLSMGMSEDFETAAMLGASCVRVGTALFGRRG